MYRDNNGDQSKDFRFIDNNDKTLKSLGTHKAVKKTLKSLGEEGKEIGLINCLVFNAVFNSITVISRRPVLLSMLSWSSFNQYSARYSF